MRSTGGGENRKKNFDDFFVYQGDVEDITPKKRSRSKKEKVVEERNDSPAVTKKRKRPETIPSRQRPEIIPSKNRAEISPSPVAPPPVVITDPKLLKCAGKGSPKIRGGSRAAALNKGFQRDGWTAYYAKESRRWTIWGPNMEYFQHLGSALTYYAERGK